MLIYMGLLSPALAASSDWTPIASGLSYKKIENLVSFSDGAIHAFQIDPSIYNFEVVVTGKDAIQTGARSITGLMQQQNAVIATNGGFFSPEMGLLGLRVSKGSSLSPIKSTSWWGIFYIKHNQAHVVSYKNYRPDSAIQFAIQAGPRLVVNGKIPKLKPGVSYRTALGIQPSNKIILLATENLLLSTQELAEIMQRPEEKNGLNCVNALNLDGGRSTQLYTRLDKLSLELPGLTKVADLIFVIPKERTKP
ncbi:MAG: hypothetical protein K0Q74_17 [Gammaproteobacteria bacterium]|nr:hypothetical protein [Gammaproteobacteria bacterium]